MNLEIIDQGINAAVFSPEMQGSGTYQVSYGYTERNQLKSIVDGWMFTYQYDSGGNTTRKQAELNGKITATTCPPENYDALNRPTTWEQTGPEGFHALSHYQYDHVNRETSSWKMKTAAWVSVLRMNQPIN